MKFWQSSVDPEKMAMTIKSLLTMLIPLALLAAPTLGIHVTQEQLVNVVAEIGLALSALATLYGVARKVYFYFKPNSNL